MAVMTLADKIADAEAALQKLMTGSLREEVDYQGRRVRFSKTDVDKLRVYINELKAELAAATCRPAGRAIGIEF